MTKSRELPLRITVIHPPSGVAFRLQRGRDELIPPASSSDDRLSFDFMVRVSGDPASGAPTLRGPFAQGPLVSRFVYVNSGTYAGQRDSPWSRRAKVPLAGITWDDVEQALQNPEAVLEARIAGTAKDGGPVCATVPLPGGGWRIGPRRTD